MSSVEDNIEVCIGDNGHWGHRCGGGGWLGGSKMVRAGVVRGELGCIAAGSGCTIETGMVDPIPVSRSRTCTHKHYTHNFSLLCCRVTGRAALTHLLVVGVAHAQARDARRASHARLVHHLPGTPCSTQHWSPCAHASCAWGVGNMGGHESRPMNPEL